MRTYEPQSDQFRATIAGLASVIFASQAILPELQLFRRQFQVSLLSVNSKCIFEFKTAGIGIPRILSSLAFSPFYECIYTNLNQFSYACMDHSADFGGKSTLHSKIDRHCRSLWSIEGRHFLVALVHFGTQYMYYNNYLVTNVLQTSHGGFHRRGVNRKYCLQQRC